MTLTALRDDALRSGRGEFELRLSLPWIRSLPLACLDGLELTVDGADVRPLTVGIGERVIDLTHLPQESGWWFLQDRVVLRGPRMLRPGTHEVAVSFRLIIPYLQIGPDGPLTLPFRVERTLVLDAAASVPSVSRDVA